jgi:amino acid transporter
MSTIMPSARMALAMATYRAIPSRFAVVNAVSKTPKFTTWTIGMMTLFIYTTLSLMSESIVEDTILSVSIAVCTFYIVAAASCALYFHRTAFNHWRTAISQVILPAIAAIVLTTVALLQAWNMLDPNYGSSGSIAGVGMVFIIGVMTLLCGVILMTLWNIREPTFFRGETLPLERAHMVPDTPAEIRAFKESEETQVHPK